MSPPTTEGFDPYAILQEFERARVSYVVVGTLARVIQGSDEVTRGVDLTPSLRPENLERLERALANLDATRVDGKPLALTETDPSQEPLIALKSRHGEIKLALAPAGTRGYDDLRRRARREHLGQGLRTQVAGAGDLVRMLEALGRETDALSLDTMRRVVELDRGAGLEL